MQPRRQRPDARYPDRRARTSLALVRRDQIEALEFEILPPAAGDLAVPTVKAPCGMASIRCGMVRRLKMPWRKSLNTTARPVPGGDLARDRLELGSDRAVVERIDLQERNRRTQTHSYSSSAAYDR